MLRKCGLWSLVLLGASTAAPADTIQLKDKAAVTGTILSEKQDQVAVDVGYTVLLIPRQQILRISKGSAPEPMDRPATPPPKVSAIESKPQNGEPAFYSSGSHSAARMTVRELVSQLGEAVVQVRTPSGLGSGFIINEDGSLITNYHVVEGETQLSVEVYHQNHNQIERTTYKQVRIVALNKFGDLALLKIEDKGAPQFKTVTLGSSDSLAVGEGVFAIGSPLGFERTVTEGILSTKTRLLAGELYLQTTAQINPGNSGGPLFNLAGEVVGVTNMKISFGEGLGFAIPIESVKFFLDHRDAFAYANDNPSSPYRYLEPPSHTRKTVQD